ncbi:hypothetical protein ACROAH_15315 [Shewanella oncorhynchi]|uniref:hypothetical protein n=1 Tax=Shewanella TaxID=22 RepID=UPI0039AF5A4F
MKQTYLWTSILLSLMFTPVFAGDDDIYSLPTESVNPQRVPVVGADFGDADKKIQIELDNPSSNLSQTSLEPMSKVVDQAASIAIPNQQVIYQQQIPAQQTEPQPNASYGGASPVNPTAISPSNAGEVISRRDDSMDYLRKQYKSHQVIALKAGGTTTLPISLSTTNRIATSFKNAKITTSVPSDSALIYSEQGFVYVTPGVNAGAIDLIVEEDGAPETAVSLYLVPLNVPPVLVELTVSYNASQRNAASQAITNYVEIESKELEAAKQAERERIASNQPVADSHVDDVMALLEVVAKAEVPAGYELLEGDTIPAEVRYPCDIRQILPLYHEVKQRLIGAKMVVDIMEVRNDVNGLRSFREEACMGLGREDVMAVGVLDRATLGPRESTEVYILRDRSYFERQMKVPRRSRVGG